MDKGSHLFIRVRSLVSVSPSTSAAARKAISSNGHANDDRFMHLESEVICLKMHAARFRSIHHTGGLFMVSRRFYIFFYHFWSAVDSRRGLPWQKLTLRMILCSTFIRDGEGKLINTLAANDLPIPLPPLPPPLARHVEPHMDRVFLEPSVLSLFPFASPCFAVL